MKRTPPMFATGRFTLKAPFNVAINTALDYTVIAIRGFSDYIADGAKDVINEVYTANGLTQNDYAADSLESASIITLISLTGEFYFVPDTYILTFPSYNSIGINRTVISIDLRAVPDLLNLDDLLVRLKDLTTTVIGVTPTVQVNKLPTPNTLTQSDYDSLETARLARVSDPRTDYQKVRELEVVNTQLKSQLSIITKKLLDDGTITATP